MTDKRLEEIRKRVEAATPGPWVPSDHDWGSNDGVYVPEPNEGVCTVHNHGVRSWSCFVAVPANNHACEIGSEAHRNMVFIAHAREDIPFLLSELAKLQAENATLRRQVEAAKEMRDLLHLRLRYCPEALWLEENYIKLKDALAALERGGDK